MPPPTEVDLTEGIVRVPGKLLAWGLAVAGSLLLSTFGLSLSLWVMLVVHSYRATHSINTMRNNMMVACRHVASHDRLHGLANEIMCPPHMAGPDVDRGTISPE